MFFQPSHQRFEVIHHRAGRDVLAGGFLQDFAPVFSSTFFKDVYSEGAFRTECLFCLRKNRDFPTSHQPMERLATDALLSVRIVAAIAFVAMICAYVYVLRHLRKIEKTIVADNLVPSELGPRNNMVLMVCLIPLIAPRCYSIWSSTPKRRCWRPDNDLMMRGILHRVREPLQL